MTADPDPGLADLLPRLPEKGESPARALGYFLWDDLLPALQRWAEGKHDGGTRLFAIKEMMERRREGN